MFRVVVQEIRVCLDVRNRPKDRKQVSKLSFVKIPDVMEVNASFEDKNLAGPTFISIESGQV